MTTTFTQTVIRPNVDVLFYNPPASDAETMLLQKRQYLLASGDMISVTAAVSEDQLTLTRIRVFKDHAAYEAFINDPVMTYNWAVRDAYNEANGITFTTEVVDS